MFLSNLVFSCIVFGNWRRLQLSLLLRQWFIPLFVFICLLVMQKLPGWTQHYPPTDTAEAHTWHFPGVSEPKVCAKVNSLLCQPFWIMNGIVFQVLHGFISSTWRGRVGLWLWITWLRWPWRIVLKDTWSSSVEGRRKLRRLFWNPCVHTGGRHYQRSKATLGLQGKTRHPA